MTATRRLFKLVFGRRLPVTDGHLEVSGVEGSLLIRRDGWGVPHIEAESNADGWFGLGFCHGQDRSFQLETLLRTGRGTLAELVGGDALPIDRLSRRIGFLHSAERQLPLLGPDVRTILEAYARGVTSGATTGQCVRSPEFVLLRAKPTKWTILDVLAAAKLMAFSLSANWDVELARFKVLTEDGPEALKALNPDYPEWLFVSAPPGSRAGPTADHLDEEIALFSKLIGHGGGSNNWALSPTRTAARRPILANDPHLPPVLPCRWYLAQVSTPGSSLAGASFVGVPALPAGHNGFAAWGITAGLIDNTDLFLEEVGADGQSLRQGEEFVPCEVRLEHIGVRGQEPVTEEVLVTSRGPIVGPALEDSRQAISLRATWLDPLPLEGLLQIHTATSFDEFRDAFSKWPAPALNVLYADASGRIGWQLVGQAPRRRKGFGLLPLAGWDPEAGWEEEGVPFHDMPWAADPESGYLATANNRPLPEGEGPFLGADWVDGYRLTRIVEALEARTDWSLAGARALQLDEVSLPWREVRVNVLRVAESHPDMRPTAELLGAWDGRVSADSPAASVFELFLAEMAERVAAVKAPNAYRWILGRGFTRLAPRNLLYTRRVGHLVRLLHAQPPGWFVDGWQDEIAAALRTACARLEAARGKDVDRWAWGAVRPLTLRHPLGDRRPLDRIFNLGPVSFGGDTNTPSQASVDPLDPTGNPGFIATLRMVVDVGDWERSRFALASGQSGNPASPHYADQLPLWRRGEGIPIPFSEAEVERATRTTLRLVPPP